MRQQARSQALGVNIQLQQAVFHRLQPCCGQLPGGAILRMGCQAQAQLLQRGAKAGVAGLQQRQHVLVKLGADFCAGRGGAGTGRSCDGGGGPRCIPQICRVGAVFAAEFGDGAVAGKQVLGVRCCAAVQGLQEGLHVAGGQLQQLACFVAGQLARAGIGLQGRFHGLHELAQAGKLHHLHGLGHLLQQLPGLQGVHHAAGGQHLRQVVHHGRQRGQKQLAGM